MNEIAAGDPIEACVGASVVLQPDGHMVDLSLRRLMWTVLGDWMSPRHSIMLQHERVA